MKNELYSFSGISFRFLASKSPFILWGSNNTSKYDFRVSFSQFMSISLTISFYIHLSFGRAQMLKLLARRSLISSYTSTVSLYFGACGNRKWPDWQVDYGLIVDSGKSGSMLKDIAYLVPQILRWSKRHDQEIEKLD